MGAGYAPGERGPNGEYGIKALSWKDMDDIVRRFELLNPYDREKLPGSILKIEDVNFHNGKRIELFALAISAKRYLMYRYDAQGNIVMWTLRRTGWVISIHHEIPSKTIQQVTGYMKRGIGFWRTKLLARVQP